mgnify:CR=1 FL=1
MLDAQVEQYWDVIVVGGGPAGYFAAIRCAETASQAGTALRVLIIERARRSLGKVIISGGERCNVTHACFDPAQLVTYYPRGGAALRGPFSRFQPRDTVNWFEQRGVALKTEEDGRMFPVSDSSRTIVECLEDAARQAGVTVWNLASLVDLERCQPESQGSARFKLRLRSEGQEGEQILLARSVLFASGSESSCHAMILRLGHTIEPPVPSLFTFKITDARIEELAGLSVPKASLKLETGPVSGKAAIPPQQGPLLITHWGMSGPAILKLSAFGARVVHELGYHFTLQLNWLGETGEGEVGKLLSKEDQQRKLARNANPFLIPHRLWEFLLAKADIAPDRPWGEVGKKDRNRLMDLLTNDRYAVVGKTTFKEEFVTAGGVALEQVDPHTMQSRVVPGLYFAGEVLDIDGITGGFNFQAAWTTGFLAGKLGGG